MGASVMAGKRSADSIADGRSRSLIIGAPRIP
jgi:hypothetical protein